MINQNSKVTETGAEIPQTLSPHAGDASVVPAGFDGFITTSPAEAQQDAARSWKRRRSAADNVEEAIPWGYEISTC